MNEVTWTTFCVKQKIRAQLGARMGSSIQYTVRQLLFNDLYIWHLPLLTVSVTLWYSYVCLTLVVCSDNITTTI